ncbi:Hsp20/alpha crystallin family protein [Hymenobacter sp. BRD67]|uniref:Hsp20/alpha crystallin family protein n=1 Tax=Hymenobacter sp. BRD67 TaxID=2675877 RepID=UPI001563B29E|nr:Hsp20/alpha crystallin family protein [Hymenobacter sp. BRD67]QKG54521.1 Hsp20 family protein [Hymenobacter sp. BRD67]
MKLISREFIRTIAPQLDLLNTIGGGVAQPKLHVNKRPKGVVLHVAMPSVPAESFHVVLKDSQLTVYGEYKHGPEDQLAAPLFVQTLDLPRNLDLASINASHENGELRVAIPFRDATSREIDIQPGS